MGGECSTCGERSSLYRVLLGKPEAKRPLVCPKYRWKDNIKMDVQELGCGVMYWIDLAQDRGSWRALVNAVTNHQFPKNAEYFLTS
jgi:hypothetical protein